MKLSRSVSTPILSFLLLTLVGVGLFFFTRAMAPTFYNGTYLWDSGVIGTFEEESLRMDAKGKLLTVTLDMELPLIHAGTFTIRPDDCLNELWVNDRPVDDPHIPFCDTEGRGINLRPFIHAGTNHIRATIKDTGGSAGIRIHQDPRKDPLILSLETLYALLIFALGFRALR